jgi:hypothetical protein
MAVATPLARIRSQRAPRIVRGRRVASLVLLVALGARDFSFTTVARSTGRDLPLGFALFVLLGDARGVAVVRLMDPGRVFRPSCALTGGDCCRSLDRLTTACPADEDRDF